MLPQHSTRNSMTLYRTLQWVSSYLFHSEGKGLKHFVTEALV